VSVEKGAIFDEAKKSLESCRLVAKVLAGGAGFQKIECCNVELTPEDAVANYDESVERFTNGQKGKIIDESKNYPNSCGLKLEIVDGGAGFKSVSCCGNTLTLEADSI